MKTYAYAFISFAIYFYTYVAATYGNAYTVCLCVIYLVFISTTSVQNANVQRMRVESLSFPVHITPKWPSNKFYFHMHYTLKGKRCNHNKNR